MGRKRHEPCPSCACKRHWYARGFAVGSRVSTRCMHEMVKESCTLEIGSMGECGESASVEVDVGEMGPILRPPSLSIELVLFV